MKKTKILLAMLAISVIMTAAAAKITVKTEEPVYAGFEIPIITNVFDSVILSGTLVERGREAYYPQGPCRVINVYARIGDSVPAGQALLEVEVISDAAQANASIYSEINSLLQEYSVQNYEAAIQSIIDGNDEKAVVQGGEGRYYIYSDISGIVMDIASLGDTLSGFASCAIVSDMSRLAVSAYVSENSLAAINEGMRCQVTVDALADSGFSGTVSTIMPYARQAGLFSQTQEIKTELIVEIDNPSKALRPGYSATVKTAANMRENAITLHYETIGQDENNIEYIMVYRNGYAIRQNVIVGREMEEICEILSGVEINDMVLLNPENYENGQRVILK